MRDLYISHALNELAPGAQWTMNGDDYSGIVWYSDDIPQPTILAVENKIDELLAREPMRRLRVLRDEKLKETDWWAMSDRAMSPEQTAYRQALRDLPNTVTPVLAENMEGISGFDWPTKP